MKKQDSWTSEYRKKKFYEKRNKFTKVELGVPFFKEENKNPKSIAILLDIEGTSDNINSETKAIFVKQLDYLCKKFNAEFVTISISTHYSNSIKIKKVLSILNHDIPSNIKIGLSFYYGGIYDYNNDKDIPKNESFNQSKIDTFKEYYINNDVEYDIKWCALIDDGMYEDEYKKFQKVIPMLQGMPSNRKSSVDKNNFMRIATTTYGFDGVIEILGKYIEQIKEMNPSQIFEHQKNIISHLPSFLLRMKIFNREYEFLERYFKEGYADQHDYEMVCEELCMILENQSATEDEMVLIKNILRFINSDQKVLELTP